MVKKAIREAGRRLKERQEKAYDAEWMIDSHVRMIVILCVCMSVKPGLGVIWIFLLAEEQICFHSTHTHRV